jgi:hypothetical protein
MSSATFVPDFFMGAVNEAWTGYILGGGCCGVAGKPDDVLCRSKRVELYGGFNGNTAEIQIFTKPT